MAQLIARISKGTKMDQIYLPKHRQQGLEAGTYVAIEPILKQKTMTPFYYKVKEIEPIKVQMIKEIFNQVEAENVIIAGSFLEKGFNFNDIDIVIIDGQGEGIKDFILDNFGLEAHIISIDYSSLRKGLDTDPLFQMLLSRFVSKERTIFKIDRKINYKLLDLSLLNSELLVINFEFLSGEQKYKYVRNLFAIKMFLEGKEMTKEKLETEINNYFGKETTKEIIDNTIQRKPFLEKYKKIYKNTFIKIMGYAKNDAK